MTSQQGKPQHGLSNREISRLVRRTRGGRISRRGFWIIWPGVIGIIITRFWFYGPAPGPAVYVLFGASAALIAAGAAVVAAGERMDKRALAEYHRKVEAGELPPWKIGDPDPLDDRKPGKRSRR